MSKTETVQTAYGEASIEVVECDSCGNEVSKDDARVFVTGDRMNERSREVKVRGHTRTGYICDYCDDSGPMSFPGQSKARQLERATRPLWYDPNLEMIHPIKIGVWLTAALIVVWVLALL